MEAGGQADAGGGSEAEGGSEMERRRLQESQAVRLAALVKLSQLKQGKLTARLGFGGRAEPPAALVSESPCGPAFSPVVLADSDPVDTGDHLTSESPPASAADPAREPALQPKSASMQQVPAASALAPLSESETGVTVAAALVAAASGVDPSRPGPGWSPGQPGPGQPAALEPSHVAVASGEDDSDAVVSDSDTGSSESEILVFGNLKPGTPSGGLQPRTGDDTDPVDTGTCNLRPDAGNPADSDYSDGGPGLTHRSSLSPARGHGFEMPTASIPTQRPGDLRLTANDCGDSDLGFTGALPGPASCVSPSPSHREEKGERGSPLASLTQSAVSLVLTQAVANAPPASPSDQSDSEDTHDYKGGDQSPSHARVGVTVDTAAIDLNLNLSVSESAPGHPGTPVATDSGSDARGHLDPPEEHDSEPPP